MSRITNIRNQRLLQRISDLEYMISELIYKIDSMKQELEKQADNTNVNAISDVHSIQVGDSLVTQKTGWIIDKGEVICEGNEQCYLEKQLPFSIMSIKKRAKI